MWFAFSLAISVFDITVIIINCSFLSCVINIKRGSTPGIFILEGLHWIGGDIYICHYFFPLAVSAGLSAFPDLTFSKFEAYTQKNLAAGIQPKAISFLLSLDIYTMWKVSCHIVRKSVENTHTRSSLKVVVVVVFFNSYQKPEISCFSLYSVLRARFCQHYFQVPSLNDKEWTPPSTPPNCCSWLKSHFWKVLLCGRPRGLLQSCYWPPVLLGTLQATRFFISSRRLNMYKHEREVEHSKKTQNWKSRSPKCLGQETTAWG